MNMFIMHELQLKKQISFNNRFQNSPEDTLKDACLYVLTTLEEGKTIWEKDILYVIYRYFQITHLIIKNKFSKLINDKVQQRSIIIIMYACSVGSDSLRLLRVTCLAPLSIAFSRQGYWNRLPFPPPGDLPDSGIEPKSLVSPPLAGIFFFF